MASLLGGTASGKLGSTDLNVSPQLSGINSLGGTYALSLGTDRQTTDSSFNTLNPQYPSSLSLNITQPLWRGLRYDENRNRLQVARKNKQLSAQAAAPARHRSRHASRAGILGARLRLE